MSYHSNLPTQKLTEPTYCFKPKPLSQFFLGSYSTEAYFNFTYQVDGLLCLKGGGVEVGLGEMNGKDIL